MTRYSDNHPNISRPFHLALGAIRQMSDDEWDFYLASVFGDVETLTSIHARNPDVDGTIHYEFPLIMAVRQGRTDAVRFLLHAHGGSIDGAGATNDNVWFSRCIDAAHARGFSEIHDMLEACRAKAEAHAASDAAHKIDETLKPSLNSGDVTMLKNLLAGNARLTDVARDDQMQILLWAYDAAADETVICEMLGLLIDHGIDPNCGPLIHYASERNSLPIVRLLLEKGADPNTVVDSCSNCMWIARFANPDDHHEMHKLLKGYGGRIMLHHEDEIPPVNDLLTAGSEVRDPTYPGGELLWAILREDNVSLLDKFVEIYGTQQIEQLSPCNHWYAPRSAAMLDQLVKYGFNVNQRDWRGRTMIFLAPLEQFDDYLRHGADLDVVEFMECSTRLGYAAFYDNLAMAEFLLKHGADPNLPVEHAWARPLAQAQQQNHPNMVALLKKHGAK